VDLNSTILPTTVNVPDPAVLRVASTVAELVNATRANIRLPALVSVVVCPPYHKSALFVETVGDNVAEAVVVPAAIVIENGWML
jgi:hypothetical protein